MSYVQRKSYYRSDGTFVRGHQVCRKSKVRIGTLKKGQLTEFGYHLADSQVSRRHSLLLAMHEYGPLSVFRKVNAIAVLQKRTSPKNSKTASNDAKWISNNYL